LIRQVADWLQILVDPDHVVELRARDAISAIFIDRPATTWPGLVLVIAGLPVYWLIRRA